MQKYMVCFSKKFLVYSCKIFVLLIKIFVSIFIVGKQNILLLSKVIYHERKLFMNLVIDAKLSLEDV